MPPYLPPGKPAASMKPARPPGLAWLAKQPDDVRASAASWLATPALSALAHALGGPVIRDIPDDLPALAQWSRQALDTRSGAERHEALPARLPDTTIRLLADAGRDLGLLATSPPELSAYDMTVILGGTATGNRLRVGLAAEFAQRGTDLGTIAGLSAHRLITASERTAEQVPDAERAEWQNLLRELSTVFNLGTQGRRGPQETLADFQAALDKGFANPAGREIRILVAPSRDPKRRADTADAIEYLVRQIPAPRRRFLLIITSAIYAPYQFFAIAPKLLAAGTEHAEFVGSATQTTGDKALLAQRIAQEIHSAINATCHLWAACAPSVDKDQDSGGS